jgi:hypothetical protein
MTTPLRELNQALHASAAGFQRNANGGLNPRGKPCRRVGVDAPVRSMSRARRLLLRRHEPAARPSPSTAMPGVGVAENMMSGTCM